MSKLSKLLRYVPVPVQALGVVLAVILLIFSFVCLVDSTARGLAFGFPDFNTAMQCRIYDDAADLAQEPEQFDEVYDYYEAYSKNQEEFLSRWKKSIKDGFPDPNEAKPHHFTDLMYYAPAQMYPVLVSKALECSTSIEEDLHILDQVRRTRRGWDEQISHVDKVNASIAQRIEQSSSWADLARASSVLRGGLSILLYNKLHQMDISSFDEIAVNIQSLHQLWDLYQPLSDKQKAKCLAGLCIASKTYHDYEKVLKEAERFQDEAVISVCKDSIRQILEEDFKNAKTEDEFVRICRWAYKYHPDLSQRSYEALKEFYASNLN